MRFTLTVHTRPHSERPRPWPGNGLRVRHRGLPDLTARQEIAEQHFFIFCWSNSVTQLLELGGLQVDPASRTYEVAEDVP